MSYHFTKKTISNVFSRRHCIQKTSENKWSCKFRSSLILKKSFGRILEDERFFFHSLPLPPSFFLPHSHSFSTLSLLLYLLLSLSYSLSYLLSLSFFPLSLTLFSPHLSFSFSLSLSIHLSISFCIFYSISFSSPPLSFEDVE